MYSRERDFYTGGSRWSEDTMAMCPPTKEGTCLAIPVLYGQLQFVLSFVQSALSLSIISLLTQELFVLRRSRLRGTDKSMHEYRLEIHAGPCQQLHSHTPRWAVGEDLGK